MLISMLPYRFSDDFSSGDLTKTQNGFAWNPTNNPDIVDFDTRKCARFKFKGSPSGDAWSEMRFTLGNDYPDVWVQFLLFVPNGYKQRSPGGDKSFVHLWDDDYNNPRSIGCGFSSWSESSLNLDRVLSFNQYFPQNPHVYDEARNRPQAIDDYMIGKWTEITINVKAGTGNNDGHAKVWKDGNLVYELSKNNHPDWWSPVKFLYEAGKKNAFNQGYLFGWSNSGYDQDTYLYITDFYFDDKPIPMGNNVPMPSPAIDSWTVAPVTTTRPTRDITATKYTGNRISIGDPVSNIKIKDSNRGRAWMKLLNSDETVLAEKK